MNAAVIDLGTNTFNLLIAKPSDSGFSKVFGKKLPAKLGADSIGKNRLSEAAIQRGVVCLKEFKADIDQHGSCTIYAFATSAVRSATNGNAFVELVKAETGIDINIISGDKEAELIYYGNKQALEIPESPSLILDIGGGSNEFIICNNEAVLWKQSFDLGTFRLIDQFRPTYPISQSTIDEMEAYFDTALIPVFEACKMNQPQLLIGSSGSFDSFRAILEHTSTKRVPEHSTSFPITIEEIEHIYKHICSLSLDEIAKVPGIDKIRVEIITVATVFVWYVVKRFGIKSIEQSSYSLKEGVVFKIFNGMGI